MLVKRGRKKTTEHYFGPPEEQAVIDFLTTEDEKLRNDIYNQWLKKPLDKMIFSIIRRYKLYRKDYSVEDLHADTLSHLITKASGFEPETGKKSYSYFGTICKNYLIGLVQKDAKDVPKKLSFEDNFSAIEQMESMTYYMEEEDNTHKIFIGELIKEIKVELAKAYVSQKKNNENEIKVGEALVEILSEWEKIFDSLGGSKYYKNTILATIRDYTNLTTKDIRTSMKRYKRIYTIVKNTKINNGYI